jgi:hypothetical protein
MIRQPAGATLLAAEIYADAGRGYWMSLALRMAQNKLIDAKLTINAQTLPKVQMPNRNGLIPRLPDRMPKA